MLGAITGDIMGSRFEFNNCKSTDFELFTPECSFTDDTICTIAVADALIKGVSFEKSLREWCEKYPFPKGAYGGSFASWLRFKKPRPYNSYGNGSAMRVSPCGWVSNDIDKVTEFARPALIPVARQITLRKFYSIVAMQRPVTAFWRKTLRSFLFFNIKVKI